MLINPTINLNQYQPLIPDIIDNGYADNNTSRLDFDGGYADNDTTLSIDGGYANM